MIAFRLLFPLLLSATILNSCMDHGSELVQLDVKEGSFTTPLAIIGVQDAKNTGFAAKANAVNLLGSNTTVWGYGNGILGPALEIKRGETASIKFRNELSIPTNIHWHGLVIPANMDGHPDQSIPAGQSFDYNFEIDQRAGTYWFHPHLHLWTGEQVHQGLAGFFIVRDDEELALGLPSGTAELPMVIQDKRIVNDKDLRYDLTGDDVATGYFGDHVMVNGVYAPVHQVAMKWHRLRLLNGSNARIYNLALSNGKPFYVIGSDGGLLLRPEAVTELLLSPGERVDILVDFTKETIGSEVYLQSNRFDAGVQGKQAFKILKFKIDQLATDPFTLPASLTSFQSLPSVASNKTRVFDISNAGHGAGHGGGHGGGGHNINLLTFDPDRIDETVKAGDIEIWEFDNSEGLEPHPMHIHGVLFQVLKREGGRGQLIASEKGWKDTVLALPGEKVSVIMVFPANTGKYVFHCHNLEHEEDGMMLNYEIK